MLLLLLITITLLPRSGINRFYHIEYIIICVQFLIKKIGHRLKAKQIKTIVLDDINNIIR